MKEDYEHSAPPGLGAARPDLLAELEHGDKERGRSTPALPARPAAGACRKPSSEDSAVETGTNSGTATLTQPWPGCCCRRGCRQGPDVVRHRTGTEPCGACGASGSRAAVPETTGPARKERRELSLPEKVHVLKVLEGPKVSQSELARRFGVSQPQICRIIKNRERILSEWQHNSEPVRKRRREAGDAAVEAALLRWLEATRAAGLTVSAPLLQGKAKALAETLGWPGFDAGGAWLARFGARHNVALEVPAEPPVAPRWADAALPDALHGYTPRDVYSCGETAVLLRAGTGHRLALLLCANADGSEKVALLAVGQSARPRCLRGVNLPQMPWTYRASNAARVTAPLFAEWLRGFDEAMGRRGRRVALLLAERDAPLRLALAHVHMVFMPPGAALLQPLERGAVRELKGHYRRRLLLRPPATPPSLLDALHVLAQAWGDVRPASIAACFRAAGFSRGAPAAPLPGPEQDEELDGSGEPEDAEMTELADWEGDTGEDGDTEEPATPLPCPSRPEVQQSLATLRRYLEHCATSPELFQAFYQLEDAVQAAAPALAPLGDARAPP